MKLATLRPWLGDNTLFTAYGDTPADVPMLELSAAATVVGRNAQLLTIAAARGWRAGGVLSAARDRVGIGVRRGL